MQPHVGHAAVVPVPAAILVEKPGGHVVSPEVAMHFWPAAPQKSRSHVDGAQATTGSVSAFGDGVGVVHEGLPPATGSALNPKWLVVRTWQAFTGTFVIVLPQIAPVVSVNVASEQS
jgi:hypothetical protein